MTRSRAVKPPASARTSRWRGVPENVAIAAVTAAVTTFITVAGPPIGNWLYSAINRTNGVTAEQAAFQASRWETNYDCANAQPVWHDTQGGRQIDATICPRTGHILVAMRDGRGKQVQWWPNLQGVEQQFDSGSAGRGLAALIEAPARAATLPVAAYAGPGAGQSKLAQNVLCQWLLPDRRGLRRRLVVGPNQCVELIVDTYTGQVVSQRPVPCVPNCAVNV